MRIGVLLSGCGVFDGAEIYESVITLLALDRAGVEAVCMAPDVAQLHVIDHRTGQVMEGETRNVLTEAARICRGAVLDLAGVSVEELDGLLLPGGFGAAKNLSDFALEGAACEVLPEVARMVGGMLEAGKPVGAICIAPAVVAAVLRDAGRAGALTVGLAEGENQGAGEAIEAMGVTHLACPVGEIREDRDLGLVSTPAYMEAGRISEAAEGIEALVARVLELARAR
jgi:enhancing lycopene biosynthesis protein 2